MKKQRKGRGQPGRPQRQASAGGVVGVPVHWHGLDGKGDDADGPGGGCSCGPCLLPSLAHIAPARACAETGSPRRLAGNAAAMDVQPPCTHARMFIYPDARAHGPYWRRGHQAGPPCRLPPAVSAGNRPVMQTQRHTCPIPASSPRTPHPGLLRNHSRSSPVWGFPCLSLLHPQQLLS